jgi:hypothetical protein
VGIERLRTRGIRRALALVAVGALVALGAGAASGRPAPSPRAVDDAEDCVEAVPAAVGLAGVLDDGRRIDLDVHVLLDGMDEARGAEVMRQVQQAYTPLGIRLRPTFQTVSVPAQTRAPDDLLGEGEPVPTSDSNYLIEAAKEAVGGTRPDHADVVYLMTNVHMSDAAGRADCIGGVRYPSMAFAVGEHEPDEWGSINLCCTWKAAKIAAHEIAHLLGAHHHYSNCVEGATVAVEDSHLPTCTVMINDWGLINLRFSALEGAAIRGHALEWADRDTGEPAPTPPPSASPPPSATPTPTPPPSGGATAPPTAAPTATPEPTPPPSSTEPPQPTAEPSPSPDPAPMTYLRSVGLVLKRHLVAKGRVDAGEASSCSAGAAVLIERRRGGEWRTVDAVKASATGRFRARIPDEPGRYRAVVTESSFADGEGEYVCAVAASAPIRHRHR